MVHLQKYRKCQGYMVLDLLGNFCDFILYGVINGDRDVGVSEIFTFRFKIWF